MKRGVLVASLLASSFAGGEVEARDAFFGFFETDKGVVVIEDIPKQRSRYSVHAGGRVFDMKWSPYAGKMVSGDAVYSMVHHGHGHSGLVDKYALRNGFSGAIMNRGHLPDLSKESMPYWPRGWKEPEKLESMKEKAEEQRSRRNLLLERRMRKAEYRANNNGSVIIRNYFRERGVKVVSRSSFRDVAAVICVLEREEVINYLNRERVKGLDEKGRKLYGRYEKSRDEVLGDFMAKGFRIVDMVSNGKGETVRCLDEIFLGDKLK